MMSKSIVFFLQFILLIFAIFQDATCKVSAHDTAYSKELEERSTIFDSRVLNKVRKLFTQSVQTLSRSPTQAGQKKSIITTVDEEKPLRVKIDPRQFGNALLNRANENAARKSDIYMNKAIDATALGVAVLKLIFGKDARMVMKDTKSEDTKANLRTNEARPKITSWTSDMTQNADRKSLDKDGNVSSKGSNGVGKLSMDILNLVKSFQPGDTAGKTTQNGEAESANENMASQGDERKFKGSEGNLERLFSLLKESATKEENGDKKSWVLLKVPSKQPQDELGMLTDPAATEGDNEDNDSQREDTGKIHKNEVKMHHKKKAKLSHTKQSNKRLLTRIQHQVKHLADLVSKQNSNDKETSAQKHQKLPETPQQSYEGKSFTTSTRVPSKTLKSEPLQEVNAVKTDTTSYENSVRNLLKALERSAQKHSVKTLSHVSKHEDKGGKMKSGHRKIDLVPLKNKEEQAASKDLVNGANPAGGAVVSLDALRQLGSLLGLSSPKPDEKRISPYTGTQDTLTLASPMPPTVPPTAPPAPAITPSVQYNTNQQNSLARISEQLKMFAERGLRSHNDYRKLHHAQPLKWSEDLASAAEKLAYQAAKRGSARRSELVEKKGYGENVAKIPNTALENAGEEATRHWYNEKQNFTFSDPVVDEGTKAFTQIIWKGTQTLGMGAAKDDDTGELYVVALYNPKGNEQETLRENLAADGVQHSDVYASIFKKSFAARH